MKPETQLDHAIFQLTPTRTRCELYISSGGISEKLASGLVKPFLDHLQTAAEQIAKGGYSIRLEPPDRNGTPWFSKGTMERFVRFVSTPEVLERVSTVEMELTQLEQTINAHNNSESGREEDLNSNVTAATSLGLEKAVLSSKSRPNYADTGDADAEENYKVPLFRALDARRIMLQKEQGMAFARATAAGFGLEQINDLMAFAQYFGATRLREACAKFKALRKKRQEAGVWLEETDLAALDPTPAGNEMHFGVMAGSAGMATYARSKDHPELWPDLDGRIEPNNEEHHAEKTSNMTSRVLEDGGFLNGEKQHPPHYLTPEEVSLLLQHSVDGKGFPEEHRNSEIGRIRIARAYQALASWQGQPQQFMQAVPQHPPLGMGMVHAFPQNLSLNVQGHYEPPYAFGDPARGPQPGILPNPHYLGNSPFLQRPYLDGNGPSMWHVPDASAKQVGQVHIPSTQNWPATQVYGDTLLSDSQQFPIGSTFSPQQHDVDSSIGPSRDDGTGMYISPKTAHTKNTLEDDESNSPLDKDYQSPAEARRLSRRSSSPRRRSPSPLRRVQIGRAGSKRSSMVVIRNINYIAPNAQDRLNQKREEEGEDESSGSWSEKDDVAISNGENLQTKVDSLQMSVQDAIEVFESSQKDPGEANKKTSKHRRQEKERLRSKSRDTSLDTHSERSEESINIYASSGETKCNSQNHWPKDKLDSIDSEGNIDGGSSNEVYKLNLCKSFQDDVAFLPERTTQRSQNSNNIAGFEFEAASPRQLSYLNKKVVEDDFFVMAKKGETVQTYTLSRSVPDDESEVGLDSQRCHASEEAQLLPERGRVEGKVHAFFGLEMLVEQEESALNPQPRKNFGAEQQQETLGSLDDSFIVPERSVSQKQSKTGWRTAMGIDFEMPSDGVTGKNAKAAYTSERAQEPEDMFGIIDRNTEKPSAGRPWNTVLDYDTQLSIETAANKHNDDNKQESESIVQEGQNCQLYDEYSEKRDAKMRERPASNKTEREAKLKAMHEALEKRKAEMEKNRKSGKVSPLVEAQLRAEKLRALKADLQRTKKEKEEEERKRLEELISQRKERIATRSGRSSADVQSTVSTPRRSKSLGSTSRASIVSKLSATSTKSINSADSTRDSFQVQNSLSPKRISPKGSNAIGISQSSHKSLSHSISSLTELRKENNRNSTLRASTGSQPTTVFKSSSQVGHLKSMKDPSTLTNGQVDKRPTHNATSVRKSVPEARGGSVLTTKVSKNSPSDANQKKVPQIAATNIPQNMKRVQKPSNQSAHNEKGQVKESITHLLSDSMLDEEVIENKGIEIASQVTVAESANDENETEKIVPGPVYFAGASEASASVFDTVLEKADSNSASHEYVQDVVMINESLNHGEVAELANEMISEHTSVPSAGAECYEQGTFSSKGVRSPPKLKTLLHESDEAMSPDSASRPHLDCATTVDAFHALHLNAPSDCSFDSTFHNASANVRSFTSLLSPAEESMPSELVVCDYSVPVINSPVQSRDISLPKLQQSVSPISHNVKADLATSQKKHSSSEKFTTSGSQSKEHMKGLKKLLRFGRKSNRSSGNNISDWVSITTSEGDEDIDKKRLGAKSVERKAKSGVDRYSNSKASSNGHGNDVNPNGFNSQVRLATNYKSRDDHASEGAPVKAARSFFSLSTFRSKASEGKSR